MKIDETDGNDEHISSYKIYEIQEILIAEREK